jgi:Dynein light chain type 1
MSDRKAVIKNADMGEEMQQDAVDCATQALEKYNIEKVIATDHKGNLLEYKNHRARLTFLPLPFPLFSGSLCLFYSIDPTAQKEKRKINTRLLLCMHAIQK